MAGLRHKTRARVCPPVAGLIGPSDRKSVQPMAARDDSISLDHLAPITLPALCDGRIFPTPRALLERVQRDQAGVRRLSAIAARERLADRLAVPPKRQSDAALRQRLCANAPSVGVLVLWCWPPHSDSLTLRRPQALTFSDQFDLPCTTSSPWFIIGFLALAAARGWTDPLKPLLNRRP